MAGGTARRWRGSSCCSGRSRTGARKHATDHPPSPEATTPGETTHSTGSPCVRGSCRGRRAGLARRGGAPSSSECSDNLTHWTHASFRQVRLRPPRAHRDGGAGGRSGGQREELGRLQDIPHGFLQAILADLRRSGIVISQRGQSGGWRMGRAPETVSVADVIRAVDDPLVSVYGLRPESVSYNGSAPRCSSTCGSRPAARCATSSSRSRSSSSPRAAARGGHRRPATRTPGSRTERSAGVLRDRVRQPPPELLPARPELPLRASSAAQRTRSRSRPSRARSIPRGREQPLLRGQGAGRAAAGSRGHGRRAPRGRRTQPRRSPCPTRRRAPPARRSGRAAPAASVASRGVRGRASGVASKPTIRPNAVQVYAAASPEGGGR